MKRYDTELFEIMPVPDTGYWYLLMVFNPSSDNHMANQEGTFDWLIDQEGNVDWLIEPAHPADGSEPTFYHHGPPHPPNILAEAQNCQ